MPKPNDQAAETTVANKSVPLGAKIFRKAHRGISKLSQELTGMAGELDACEAKDAIGGLVTGLGTMSTDIGKSWAKYYKDHDIDAEDELDPATKGEDSEGEGADDGDVEDALNALMSGEGDGKGVDDEDDEANLTPGEKRAIEERIKTLEAEEEHYKRLEAMATK